MKSWSNKEALLIEAVRSEIRAGVAPLSEQVLALKDAVQRLEAAQQAMYTKEVTDLKFKERDDRIEALESRLEKLQSGFGSLWQNTATRVGAFIVLGISLFNLWDALTRHLP